MRRLNRDSVDKPECLCNVEPGKTYSRLRGAETLQIRECLLEMQGGFCAYCERRTGSGSKDGHIEHFRKQADHTGLTLVWENLFWSCNDEATCGKLKDKCSKNEGRYRGFTEDEIINPCSDEPDLFLAFNSDGTLQPRDGLSETDRTRAEETIRIFGLAESSFLKRARHDAINGYATTIESLQTLGAHFIGAFVADQVSKLHDKPHSTAVRHFLTNFLS